MEQLRSARDDRPVEVSVILIVHGRIGALGASLVRLAGQDFAGRWDLTIWNNNITARAEVEANVAKHGRTLDVRVIHSTENYHCLVRQAVGVLARGELVLLIDDDIEPEGAYITHFVEAYRRISSECDVPALICVCGHRFSAPSLSASPEDVWERRVGLHFYDEAQPECEVHFAHANNCLLPRSLLLQLAARPIPDPRFILVDDYWMSFVLSAELRARLVKIEGASILRFSDTAFDPAIAMFNRPDVHRARLAFQAYHQARAWPPPWSPSGGA